MADVQHSALTGSSLHEPKGVAAASANTVYSANGSGSGTWQKVAVSNINTSSIKNTNLIALNVYFADLGTAGSAWVVSPLAGVISKIYSVIHATLATADAVVTSKIGGAAVTNGVVTITQSGSAIGDVDSATPTAARTVTAGQAIELASDGGPSGVTPATFTLLIDVS